MRKRRSPRGRELGQGHRANHGQDKHKVHTHPQAGELAKSVALLPRVKDSEGGGDERENREPIADL